MMHGKTCLAEVPDFTHTRRLYACRSQIGQNRTTEQDDSHPQ